jgi:hypothetical protein
MPEQKSTDSPHIRALRDLADMPGTSRRDRDALRAAANEIDRLSAELQVIAACDAGWAGHRALKALRHG